MTYNQVQELIKFSVKENGDQAITGESLQNVLLAMHEYAAGGYEEADVMYGVEWDVTVADPAMTRIGNMALHRQLPIQNRMKGCLLDDDGNVVEYLPVTSWEGATLDGSRGQVMVELPEHYRKFETDGNIRRAKISEYPLPGYHYVPKMYISAYEATLQRSTNKLCSVKNSDPDYRGGNNTAGWDNTYRSLLGRPINGKTRPSLRTSARARGSIAWNILTYTCYKSVLWLYLIEYANRNSQRDFTDELTSEGYKQGGLGVGLTIFTNLGAYNNYGPVAPCGFTDALGNFSGEVYYTAYGEDGAVWSENPMCRYRGIENIFGSVSSIFDGLIISEDKYYITDDVTLFNDTSIEGFAYAGDIPSGGFISDVVFGGGGEFLPKTTGGGSSYKWCDQFDDSQDYPSVGGGAVNAYNAGVSALFCTWGSGTRLCFIPQTNE